MQCEQVLAVLGLLGTASCNMWQQSCVGVSYKGPSSRSAMCNAALESKGEVPYESWLGQTFELFTHKQVV